MENIIFVTGTVEDKIEPLKSRDSVRTNNLVFSFFILFASSKKCARFQQFIIENKNETILVDSMIE